MSKEVDNITLKLDDLLTSKAPAADATATPPPKPTEAPAGDNDDDDEDQVDNLIQSTQTVQVKLADQQADPNSPLYSVKSFDDLGLTPELLKGIYGMKFNKPSKIQERALPLLIQNPPRNMIGQSQSGTGKTAAFVLTMLYRVKMQVKAPQAVCLAPSRELARQIMDVVEQMSKFTGITTQLVVKDSYRRNQPIHAQVIVGTPGSVTEVIRRKMVATRDIGIFVLDEADNMLDQDGLGDQTLRIQTMLNNDIQTVLFSATFPDHVRRFAEKFAKNANEISLKREELSVDSIKQFYVDCDSQEHKYDVLVNLYDLLTVSQSIIFCKLRTTADEISKRMTQQGHAVLALHGKMTPEERDKVMDDFRRGEFKVLVTTNVIARGIDILQVTLVINYDLPMDRSGNPDYEAYLHRIGRTGRFGRTGVSINFVHNKETWEKMAMIEQHFQRSIELIPTNDWEEVEKRLKRVL